MKTYLVTLNNVVTLMVKANDAYEAQCEASRMIQYIKDSRLDETACHAKTEHVTYMRVAVNKKAA